MQNLQERLTEVMQAMDWEHADVMRVSGQSSSVVSQWLGKGSKIIKTIGKIEAAQALSDASGFGAAWIAKGLPPKLVARQSAPKSAIAQEMSYPQVTTPPITAWGDVVSLEKIPVIPADLMVEVPDDALAPRGISRGQHIWFKAASSAVPRNVVLIEANGRRYIRRYAEDGQGPFAQALDDAYPSFRDFKVVAVMHMRPESSI